MAMIGRLLLSPAAATGHISSAARSRLAAARTPAILRSGVYYPISARLPPPESPAVVARAARRSFGDGGKGEGGGKGGGWWDSAEFWGRCGALAGWGMSGAAMYDALESSPELISLNMTGVLLVYSSLFARWAFVVRPQNLLLAGCHVANVCAQSNQLRRAVEYKRECGKDDEVADVLMKAGATVVAGVACLAFGPTLQGMIVNSNLGPISTLAAADAGPFTVHFWAPMSKWMISGASFLELDRPTDKISIAQYTALTLTGFFFTRYALLVTPVNYTLWK
ncbi:hypothetical protein ACHAW5_002555 [Stephanodiscus triporus]|uniref:Mitochondrial pyruvate carrier n=1 Tax=Stephanodiscus triporus TaxID=2934178 RepID=A0ABD3MQM5_9STRA